jgi:GMP synthase-like glutamine amidotransferase
MHMAVIQNQADAPAGLLGDWADARGVRVTTLLPEDMLDSPDPSTFDVVAPLGSDQSVHGSKQAWVPAELDFLRRAMAENVSVLGICFGAQALAATLGAEVYALPKTECGWLEMDAVDDLHTGPWLTWHNDTFAVPDGAEVLARSALCTQAYRHGSHVGLQFHCEVTPAILDDWIEGARGSLMENRVDPETLRAACARGVDAGGPARAFALFDAIAAGWRNGA